MVHICFYVQFSPIMNKIWLTLFLCSLLAINGKYGEPMDLKWLSKHHTEGGPVGGFAASEWSSTQ